MTCHKIKTKEAEIIICCPNIYKFPHNGKEFYFEWHSFLGPTAVTKKDFEPRVTVPAGFWDAITAFHSLPEKERIQYQISD